MTPQSQSTAISRRTLIQGAFLAGIGVSSLCGPGISHSLAIAQPPREPLTHGDNVYALALSPDGKQVLTASEDNTAILFQITPPGVRFKLTHDHPVYDAAFLPGGKQAVTCDGGSNLSVWDVVTGKRLQQLSANTGILYALAVSPDGKRVAVAGGETNPVITLWDLPTGKSVARYLGHTKSIYGLAFHPKLPVLASASSDKTVRLWDEHGTAKILQGHTSHVYRCAFSPDGKWLASVGHDKVARVWDARSGAEVATLKSSRDPMYAIGFSPGSEMLATAGDDRKVQLWSTRTWQRLDTLDASRDKPVFSVVFLPMARQILAGCGDGKVIALPIPE